MKHFLQRLRYGAVAVLFAAGAFAVFLPPKTVSAQRDCDSNAVIRCGALTESELRQKMRENQNGDVVDIFEFFGIEENELTGMRNGRVTTNNDVFVGNRRVATDAVTAGRQRIGGNASTPILGGRAFTRQPSVSFANGVSSLDAFVKLDQNGNFLFAVLKSCGNPVKAKPVQQPKPKEKPKKVVKQKVPEMKVEKVVRNIDPTDWADQVRARPGDRLEYRITIRNTGETPLTDIVVHDTLPESVQFIAGSLTFSHDADMVDANDFFGDGVIINSLGVGEQIVITFKAQVLVSTVHCKEPGLKNVIHVNPKELKDHHDVAFVIVCKEVVVEEKKEEVVVVTLPETGAGAALGLFAATSISGALAHRFIYRRFK